MKPQRRLQLLLLPAALCTCLLACLAGLDFYKLGFNAFFNLSLALVTVALSALISTIHRNP